MTIELSMLVPHAPSLCHEDQVPDFQQSIVAGFKEVAKEISQIKPDVIVLVSCHWPSTFAHYVDCNPVHKGFLTAQEAPDMIKDVHIITQVMKLWPINLYKLGKRLISL